MTKKSDLQTQLAVAGIAYPPRATAAQLQELLTPSNGNGNGSSAAQANQILPASVPAMVLAIAERARREVIDVCRRASMAPVGTGGWQYQCPIVGQQAGSLVATLEHERIGAIAVDGQMTDKGRFTASGNVTQSHYQAAKSLASAARRAMLRQAEIEAQRGESSARDTAAASIVSIAKLLAQAAGADAGVQALVAQGCEPADAERIIGHNDSPMELVA